MNDLQNNTFNNIEQKPIYDQYYSYFLNKLLKVRKNSKYTTRILAKAFNCSGGTISNFENRVKDHDFVMLFRYAAFFDFKLEMYLSEMTYCECMSK